MPAAKNLPAVREVELTPAGIVPSSVLLEAITSGQKVHVALDNEQIAAAMLARKLGATTVEELGGTGDLDDVESIYGRPIKVMGVGVRNSDEQYEGKLGIYVVLNVVTAEGETLAVSSGATDVVCTSIKVAELDRLGKDWWTIAPASGKTAAGFTPVNMTLATADGSGEPF